MNLHDTYVYSRYICGRKLPQISHFCCDSWKFLHKNQSGIGSRHVCYDILLISSALISFYQSWLVLYWWQHLLQPSQLSTRMKQAAEGMAGGKNPMLTSKRKAQDHLTAEEKVKIEKRASYLELWTPSCSSVTHSTSHMLISFSTKLHSDAILVGVANWVTTNPWKYSLPTFISKQFTTVFSHKINLLYGI